MEVVVNNAIVFDPARRAFFYFRKNRNGITQTIEFTDENGDPYVGINTKVWQLNVKERPTDTSNVMQLLDGSGLVINASSIEITPTDTQTADLKVMTHYVELYNSTDKQTWVCGPGDVHIGEFDAAGADADATINITISTTGVEAASQAEVNTGSVTDEYVSPSTLQDKDDTAVALVDASTMDLTGPKHTLASSSATRTFTISHLGDEIVIEVTLSATSATYTFPATTLCYYAGVAIGNNTMPLAGVSGDRHIITIIKIGSNYYAAGINSGQ